MRILSIQKEDIWSEKSIGEVTTVVRRVLSSMLREDKFDLVREQEDLVPLVLLQAWDKRLDFRGGSKVSTWVFRIAINITISHCNQLLRRSYHHELSFDDNDEKDPERLFPMRYDQPDQVVIEEEMFQQLQEEVERLRPEYRQVWELKRDGLSYKQIATALHDTVSAVKTRLFRARQALKKALIE